MNKKNTTCTLLGFITLFYLFPAPLQVCSQIVHVASSVSSVDAAVVHAFVISGANSVNHRPQINRDNQFLLFPDAYSNWNAGQGEEGYGKLVMSIVVSRTDIGTVIAEFDGKYGLGIWRSDFSDKSDSYLREAPGRGPLKYAEYVDTGLPPQSVPGQERKVKIVGATSQEGNTHLQLPPGGQLYVYGMATGGAVPGNFTRGQVASVDNASGVMSAALCVTTKPSIDLSTSAAYYAAGGIGISGFRFAEGWYAVNRGPAARSVTVQVSLSAPALVAVVGTASSQQDVTFSGLPNITVDVPSTRSVAVSIAHAYLDPGTYNITENSFTLSAGQTPSYQADLIAVLVFSDRPSPATSRNVNVSIPNFGVSVVAESRSPNQSPTATPANSTSSIESQAVLDRKGLSVALPSQIRTHQKKMPTFSLPSNVRWWDTGISLIAGQSLEITASGHISIAFGSPSSVTPSGSTNSPAASQEFAAPELVPFSLVGKIGQDGTPFEVGTNLRRHASTGGHLYLSVNDQYFPDNTGSWHVSVVTQAASTSGFSANPHGPQLRSSTVTSSQRPAPRSKEITVHQKEETTSHSIIASFILPSNVSWRDTGLDLIRGQSVEIKANGNISLSYGSPASDTPSGLPNSPGAGNGFPGPGLAPYSLVGKIGATGTVFEIGTDRAITASVNGRLYMMVNDDYLPDNTGSWNVTVMHASFASPAKHNIPLGKFALVGAGVLLLLGLLTGVIRLVLPRQESKRC